MKILAGAALSAVLLAAMPAYADRDRDHHRGGDRHHWQHQKQVRHYGPPRHVVHHVHRYAPPRHVVRYYEPAPVYYAPPPFGIHVMLPDIYIPLN